MSRKVLYLFPAAIIIVLIAFAVKYTFYKDMNPVSGNYINPHELQELERKAAAGDPASQYRLSIYGRDQERMVWLKKSSEAGYPKAVVVQASMMGGKDSRIMLEKVARNGYYPAIRLFSFCVDAGSCDFVSEKDKEVLNEALVWSIVSRLLVEDKKLKINELGENEKKLQDRLSVNEFEAAQSAARLIADNIANVTND